MLDHFEFCLLCHKTLMRKHSGGLDWTRTRSPPSKLDCKRARVWGLGTGNKFTGTISGNKFHLFSYNDDVSKVPFYYHYTGSNPETNTPQNSGAEQNLCTCAPIQIQDEDDDLTSFYSCNQPIPDLLFNFAIAQDIVNSEFRSDFDDDLLDWELKKDLYYFLKENPDYAELSEGLEHFVDTTEGSSMDKFYEVDLRMAALADTGLGPAQKELYRLEATSINNSVDDEFIFETNQKAYNELFLSTVFAGNYTLTTGQQSTLTEIAEQCPYHGGSAVFLARGWYTTIDHEVAYDDAALCDPSPKLGTATSNPVTFELYPTITAGQVLLQSLEDIEENMLITINNTLGEVVHRIPMTSSAITIDLERLPAGLYHLFVVKNKQIIFAEKFVKSTE